MTTQPYEPPSIAPVTLQSAGRRVHEARRRLAVARGMFGHGDGKDPALMLGNAWQRIDPSLREMYDDAELALLAEEDTLRALAVAAYQATGQMQVSPGVSVTERMDRDAGHFVPVVTLADDLGAALDAAEHERSSDKTWR